MTSKQISASQMVGALKEERRMKRDSEEYRKFKAEYEAKELYRKEHPQEYPWFAYFCYGWHHLTFLTDKEKDEVVKTYRLYEGRNDSGQITFERGGRQPIYVIERKDRKEEKHEHY